MFVNIFENNSQKIVLWTFLKNSFQFVLGIKFCLGTQIWKIGISSCSP